MRKWVLQIDSEQSLGNSEEHGRKKTVSFLEQKVGINIDVKYSSEGCDGS